MGSRETQGEGGKGRDWARRNDMPQCQICAIVGSSSQADCLKRNTAMDDSIGGS